jgi:hypothetical protein
MILPKYTAILRIPHDRRKHCMAIRSKLARLGLGFWGAVILIPAVFAADASNAPAKSPEKSMTWAELAPLQYEPKMSPDTVTDYRPKLAPLLEDIPHAALNALPQLLRLLERFKKTAREKPGEWVDGRIYLGANPREYHPSDAELLAAEVGDRIRALIKKASLGEVVHVAHKAGLDVAEVTYNRFDFRHADVMGTGRFFYCSEPRPVHISLRTN